MTLAQLRMPELTIADIEQAEADALKYRWPTGRTAIVRALRSPAWSLSQSEPEPSPYPT